MVMVEIISRETIKPSSPTPSHLHTYNLSEMDLINPKFYIPQLIIYSNNSDASLTVEQKTITLKNSLSLSLTKYYPFAGRLPTPTSPYVDCNDEGVVFLEAKSDCELDTFQRIIRPQDDAINQFFAHHDKNFTSTSNTNLVAVQLTHFTCGGLVLAISFAHTIGDASTLSSFLHHWASVARYGSTDHDLVLPNNPHYIQSPRTQPQPPEAGVENMKRMHNVVSRKFVFSNSKLSELKKKADGSINNPTRFEVLVSLLYKTAVESATARSGCFKTSHLLCMLNARDRFVPKLPQSTVGNFVKVMIVKTKHPSETSINTLTANIRKEKQQPETIQSLQELVESTSSLHAKLLNGGFENVPDGIYWCTSQCGFSFSKLDFGWGKPVGTPHEYNKGIPNTFILMDTVDDDGIEAVVFLKKECMDIFENDKEMLSYCQI